MKRGSRRTYPAEDPAGWCGVEERHGRVQDAVEDSLKNLLALSRPRNTIRNNHANISTTEVAVLMA